MWADFLLKQKFQGDYYHGFWENILPLISSGAKFPSLFYEAH